MQKILPLSDIKIIFGKKTDTYIPKSKSGYMYPLFIYRKDEKNGYKSKLHNSLGQRGEQNKGNSDIGRER